MPIESVVLADMDNCLFQASAGRPDPLVTSNELAPLLRRMGLPIIFVTGQSVDVVEMVVREFGLHAQVPFALVEGGSMLCNFQTNTNTYLVPNQEVAAVCGLSRELQDLLRHYGAERDTTRSLHAISSWTFPNRSTYDAAYRNKSVVVERINGYAEHVIATWDTAAGSFWIRPRQATKANVAQVLAERNMCAVAAAGDSGSEGSDIELFRLVHNSLARIVTHGGTPDPRLVQFVQEHGGYVAPSSLHHAHGLVWGIQQLINNQHWS